MLKENMSKGPYTQITVQMVGFAGLQLGILFLFRKLWVEQSELFLAFFF